MLKFNHTIVLAAGTTPSWNFALANFAEFTMPGSNATLTVTNTQDRDCGVLRVIGDGTSVLTLPGRKADAFSILTGAGDFTDIAFLNVGGTLFWSLIAKYTAPVSPISNLLFAAASTDLLNTAQVFTSPGGGSSFGNTGLDAKKLPSGVSGRIWYKFIDVNSENCVLGFNTVNAEAGYASMEAGIFFQNGPTTIKHIDNGTPGGGYGSPTANHFYGIFRDGATGAVKLQHSADEASWSDIATLTFNSTADLFIVCDIGGSQTMSYPKGENIV